MSAPRRTVFVVDDDDAIRRSLRLLMRSVDIDTELFASADEFLEAFDPSRAGCLLLDVRMPGTSGLELQEKLLAMGASLPVIFLTGHGDVTLAVKAMHAGAFHFFEKPFNDQELLDRIHVALEHDASIREESTLRSAVRERVDRLTPREREVMEQVVQGKANKVIAEELGISERTVEIHRARVMEKMEAPSLADLVKLSLLAAE